MSKSLVIAEKKNDGKNFASALGCHKDKGRYVEGEDYIVTWASGHLFSLYEPEDYDKDLKDWRFYTLPIIPEEFKIKLNNSYAKKQFKTINNLAKRKEVSQIINAGDTAREGELIQRYILESLDVDKSVKRAWINSMTEEAIKKEFNNLKEQSEYDNYYLSAKTRSYIDWLLGMNYTRAYTCKNEGNNMIVIGRVQTAILNLIVNRDKEINNFDPKPYNELKADFQDFKGKYINSDGDSKIFTLPKADKIKLKCKGKKAEVISIKKKDKKKNPPKLFNLTGLQKRMNKKYGFSAKKTLNIAQKLYDEKKILSYPRTDSKYLKRDQVDELPNILESINFNNFSNLVSELDIDNLEVSDRFINDSKVTDHFALIPTGKENTSEIYKTLSKNEKNLFKEVVKRLIAQFFQAYKYQTTEIITEVEDYKFKTNSKIIKDLGWKKIYNNNLKEDKLPELKEGDKRSVIDLEIINKKTKAPKYFNTNTLLSKMEKFKIGTEATRSNMIEKVLSRKYVKRKGKKLISTEAGKKIIDVIQTDKLLDSKATGDLEEKLEKIIEGKLDHTEVLNQEIKNLKKEIKKLEDVEIKVDKNKKKRICDCPACETGEMIKHSWGYGCSNWNNDDNKCDFSVGRIKRKKLTENQLKRLCNKGKTKKLRGFKSKKGNKFSAKLILTDKNKIEFKFPEKKKTKSEKSDITCPACQKANLIDRGKFYGCANYPDCNFSISKKICGVKISKEILKDLSNDQVSKMIEFKSKKGNKFSARLVIKDDEIEFEYN